MPPMDEAAAAAAERAEEDTLPGMGEKLPGARWARPPPGCIVADSWWRCQRQRRCYILLCPPGSKDIEIGRWTQGCSLVRRGTRVRSRQSTDDRRFAGGEQMQSLRERERRIQRDMHAVVAVLLPTRRSLGPEAKIGAGWPRWETTSYSGRMLCLARPWAVWV